MKETATKAVVNAKVGFKTNISAIALVILSIIAYGITDVNPDSKLAIYILDNSVNVATVVVPSILALIFGGKK